jgi:O-antigen ligase
MVNYFGGIGDNSNEFGAFMLAMFPLPLFMIQDEKSKIKKIIFSIIGLIFLLCIIRTRSRGAFVGLIIIIAFFLWENRKKVSLILILLFMLTFAYFHTHYGYWERIATLKSAESIESEHNAYTRIMQSRYALELISLHPITGVGLGNFIKAKIDLLKLDPESSDTKYASHNTYLDIGSELGIIGLLAFLIIIIASIRYCYSSERYFKTRDDLLFFQNISKSIRIGIIGFAVSIFFLSEEFNSILYQYIAITVALKNIVEKEKLLISKVKV